MARSTSSLITVCFFTIGLCFLPTQEVLAKSSSRSTLEKKTKKEKAAPKATAKGGNKKNKSKKTVKPPILPTPIPPPVLAPAPIPPPVVTPKPTVPVRPPIIAAPPTTPMPSGPPGSLKIDTREGAEVILRDLRVPASKIISDIPSGKYDIQVIAPGFPIEKRSVEIEPGKTLSLKVEFTVSKTFTTSASLGAIKVIKPATLNGNVHYLIDGRNYDDLEAQLTSSTGLKLPPSEKVVFVAYKEGVGHMEETFALHPGLSHDIVLKLENTASLFVDSHPSGATIYIDDKEMGVTPKLIEKVADGEHEISIEEDGFEPYDTKLKIEAGVGKVYNLNDIVLTEEASGKVKEEKDEKAKAMAQEELLYSFSSFSAITPPTGHGSLNIGSGWPHLFNLRFDIGMYRKNKTGISLGFEFRSSAYMSTGGVNLKFQLGQIGPMSVGFDLYGGGGGGPRDRLTGSFEAGFPISFSSAKGGIRFTLRPYLEVYVDQNCPTESQINDYVNAHKNEPEVIAKFLDPDSNRLGGEHIGDRCVGLVNSVRGPNPMGAVAGYAPNAEDGKAGTLGALPSYRDANGKVNNQFLLDGTPLLGQFIGVRFFIQAALEVQVTKRFGLYGMIEWAPFQGERQSLTDKFNRVAPINDGFSVAGPLYGRFGIFVKF